MRVSSKSQQNDGNSIEAQSEAVKNAGAEQIIIETFTGVKFDRPKLNELLEVIQPNDMIIVTKMDRFARTVSQATETITKLLDMKVEIYVLNLGILDNSSTSVLLRNMLLCFAQFERDLIIERTQEGREIAKQKPGYREGRPKKFKEKQIDFAVNLLETHSYSEVALLTGISISTLTRAKREKKAKNTVIEENKV